MESFFIIAFLVSMACLTGIPFVYGLKLGISREHRRIEKLMNEGKL